jgi:autotransporter passenger strand-loop-strand repeat protein
VQSGGILVISGGSATSTTLGAGGTIDLASLVYSGGSVSFDSSTDVLTVTEGGSSATVQLAGGYAEGHFVMSSDGGSGTDIGFVPTIIVSSGVTSQYLTLSSGVTMIVQSGSDILVSSGGSAFYTSVLGGAVLDIASGATAYGTYLESGISETVSAGVGWSQAHINNGGTEIVVSGGVSLDGFLSNGGTDIISSGGEASSTTIEGGTQTILAGGSAVGAQMQGGAQAVSSGGVASNTSIGYGASQAIYDGGSAMNTEDGAYHTQETIYSGGVASGTDVVNNGIMTVSSGGSAVSATVRNYGSAYLYGGTASDTTVRSSGDLYVSSGGAAVFTMLSGTEIVYSGGSDVSGSVSNSGTLTISNGGTASFTSVGSGGMLRVASGGSAVSVSLVSGGTIDLTSLAYSTGGTASFDSSTDLLTVTEGATSTNLQLAGDYAGEYFHLGADAGSGTDITVDGTPCYCAGSLILTDRGEIAVEALVIGDRLVTRSGAARPIHWIGRRSYSGVFARGNRDILPVTIRRGALDGVLPRRDLSVSPLHAMYIDGMLIPAYCLVNGVSIVQATRVERVAYFHLELETHDVIYAEGAASESFVNDGSRGMFHNAAEYQALYPGSTKGNGRYCAPRLEHGSEIEIVRRRIAGLAQQAA